MKSAWGSHVSWCFVQVLIAKGYWHKLTNAPLLHCSCFPNPHWLAPTTGTGAGRSRSRWDASGWFHPSLVRWRRGCWDWWEDCSWWVCSGKTRQVWPGICEDRENMKRRDFKDLEETEQFDGASVNSVAGQQHTAHCQKHEIQRCIIQAWCPQDGPLVTGQHWAAKLAFALSGIHNTEAVWHARSPGQSACSWVFPLWLCELCLILWLNDLGCHWLF